MALDSKYGKIIAERKQFHSDEPVFVLRAKDVIAPYAVEAYAAHLRAVGEAEAHMFDTIADECDNIAAAMRVWQGTNRHLVKFPD